MWNSYATCLTFRELTLYVYGRTPIIINILEETWNLLHWWEDIVRAGS
jgi:hypothetical protein